MHLQATIDQFRGTGMGKDIKCLVTATSCVCIQVM